MDGLFVAAVFIGIPWVLGQVYKSRLAHDRFMKTLQLKADMTARLLDRVGSEPQVLELLKSDIQQQLFEVRQPDVAAVSRVPVALARTITAIQAGIVLVSAGLAFLMIRPYLSQYSQDEAIFIGALSVALGMGAMLAAVATVVLTRTWRSLEETRA